MRRPAKKESEETGLRIEGFTGNAIDAMHREEEGERAGWEAESKCLPSLAIHRTGILLLPAGRTEGGGAKSDYSRLRLNT